ncbi:MAG: hypothetical protein ACFCUU_16310 [Cyclobacteriaceae bacterium]
MTTSKIKQSKFVLGRRLKAFLLTILVIGTVSIPRPSLAVFQNDSPIEILIDVDLKVFNKLKHPASTEAMVHIVIENDTLRKKINIRPRADQKDERCKFPTIIFDLPKDDDELAFLSTLVVANSCHNLETAKIRLYKEFLTSKLLSQLTEYSFKVRQCNITLSDIKGKLPTYQTIGFIREKEDQLANRLNVSLLYRQSLPFELTDPDHTALVSLFQYFLLNHNWQIESIVENICIVRSPDKNRLPYIVPFAFGDSKWMDEITDPQVQWMDPLNYKGPCFEKEVFQNAITRFLDAKNAFFNQLRQIPFDAENHKATQDYMNAFFTWIEGNDWLKALVEDCR